MTAEKINIEPLASLPRISEAQAYADQNGSKRKMAKKQPKSEEQQRDEVLEEDLGPGESRLLDYKA
ncbi:MAG: hypothetical protein A2Y07_05095 [Planctomycetes bacterium GWF2_50_10]|nr:MAG: hypothetical protein A2Y07_05095 [Planctomycetes bacterium GWF2_50_10]